MLVATDNYWPLLYWHSALIGLSNMLQLLLSAVLAAKGYENGLLATESRQLLH
jgi:hypothetical protein